MDSNRVNQLEDQRHQAIMGAIEGVHDRLDTLNGRTRSLENKVSVLSWAYGVGGVVVAYAWSKLTGHSQ